MSKTEPTSLQRVLLWTVILALGLAFFITGLILILRSIEDDSDDVVVGRVNDGRVITTTTTEAPDNTAPPLGQFRHAAVASPCEPCNVVGSEILSKYQGSAVDAAIATVICNGVINFYGSGIGGGHFFMIYDTPKGGTEKVFNTILGRERAPAAATEDMYVNGTASSVRGGKAIGVPGDIKGLYTAWQKYGRVPWAKLLEPSIEFCKRGTPVGGRMAAVAAWFEDTFADYPLLAELTIKADGSVIQEGDFVKQPKLASTLSALADDPMAFYDPTKQLAQDIVSEIQATGGIITLDDLANYEVYDKAPQSVHLNNGDYTVYGPPPPSGAVVAQYILNTMDEYQLSANSIADTDNQIMTYHRIAEAYKFAYGKRTRLADEEFLDIAQLIKNMTMDEIAAETVNIIDDSKTFDTVEHYGAVYAQEEHQGTVHVSVLAADGSAAAITSTINYAFGSFVTGNITGIIYNNEMDDFSTPGLVNSYGYRPSPANFIEPGKMPLSSMSPIIVTDANGKVVYVSGGSGGSKIISSVAFVAMNALWLGKRLDEATDTPRLHHQLLPPTLSMTGEFDQAVKDGLAAKGHNLGSTSHNPVESILIDCEEDFQQVYYDRLACVLATAGYYDQINCDGY